jgi:Ca2+-binding RTX toxin-like protein
MGTEAATAENRFIFNEGNGQLLFDRDGNGGANSQILATFTGSPELTASNISVV